MKKSSWNIFSKAKVFSLLGLMFYGSNYSIAQVAFPYDPLDLSNGAINTVVNINTSAGASPFNNLLLGSNVDFNTSVARVLLSRTDEINPETGESQRRFNQGFNAPNGQDFIADNDPVVIRFPQGVFANTYHWERVEDEEGTEIAAADSRHIIDPFIVDGRTISRHDSPTSVRIGYPALRAIFDRAVNNGKPLDLLTVLSIIGNDADSNGRRWQSMINDGHDVRDMELGNEFFFKSQRSGTINTEAQWVARARQIVANIENRANALERSVRFAIPISFRGGDPTQPQSGRDFHQNYNDAITIDESIFDAIVVHRYVTQERANGITPEDLSPQALRNLISASEIMDQSLMYCKTQVSEDKNSIWLTEWGVSGSEDAAIGASFLGTADIYSHIITNNSRLEVERANWFSAVGANQQYTVSGTNTNVIIGTTGYGDIYRILRDNLRDANLFNDVAVTAPTLEVGSVAQEGKSVHVLSVQRADGTPRFIITNKTNEMARVFVDRDGVRENVVNYRADGVRWEDLGATTSTPYTNEETQVGAILVPPYSVTKVDMSFGEGTPILSLNTNETTERKTEVALHPNPTSSTLNIVLRNITKANILITDVLGKAILQMETDQGSVQLQTSAILKSGIYLVNVTDQDNRRFVSKLVVD